MEPTGLWNLWMTHTHRRTGDRDSYESLTFLKEQWKALTTLSFITQCLNVTSRPLRRLHVCCLHLHLHILHVHLSIHTESARQMSVVPRMHVLYARSYIPFQGRPFLTLGMVSFLCPCVLIAALCVCALAGSPSYNPHSTSTFFSAQNKIIALAWTHTGNICVHKFLNSLC